MDCAYCFYGIRIIEAFCEMGFICGKLNIKKKKHTNK